MAVSKDDAQSLVFQYSEWLDGERLLADPDVSGNDSSHEDLVAEFLATRDSNAIPEVME